MPRTGADLTLAAVAAACVTAAAGVLPASPRAQEPPRTRSVWEGVFSKAQADRGRTLYQAECARCHPQGPATGAAFMTVWNGRTADDLFQQLKSTMPQDGPGRLARRAYLDLAAYILEANGFPDGAVLKIESQTLQSIRIEPKRGSSEGPP